MNERIKELMIQCEKKYCQDHDDYFYDMEKFAELIVKECAKFLDENSGYDDANNAWHPEPEELLEHFGVSE
jgi:hypothetical protein